MTDLNEPLHTIGQIAKAANLNPNTIRAWYQRGDLSVGMSDKASPGNTIARRFTGHTALMIGIMGTLVSMGVLPGRAQLAAASFAHSGDDERLPGHLFADGETLLVVGGGHHLLLNLTSGASFSEVWSRAQVYNDGKPDMLLFVKLDELVDSIRVGLGLGRDPLERASERPTGYSGEQ